MRVLALDIGQRRIGVAVSDPSGTVARPLLVLHRRSRREDLAAISALVNEHGVERVIVGRPLTLRGEVGPQAQRVEQLSQTLSEMLTVPVQLWDERYSTVAAQEIVQATRRPARSRKPADLDAVAAAVILQGFLDSHAAGAERTGE